MIFLGHGDNAKISAAYAITNIFFGSEYFLYTVIPVSPAVAMVLTGKMRGFDRSINSFWVAYFQTTHTAQDWQMILPDVFFLNFESEITPCLRQGPRAMVWGFHFPFNQSQSWRSQLDP